MSDGPDWLTAPADLAEQQPVTQAPRESTVHVLKRAMHSAREVRRIKQRQVEAQAALDAIETEFCVAWQQLQADRDIINQQLDV